MIKFFRKIRQNLLSQGKTNRYFKYAVGEILLVVIGILIALQMNEWNSALKDKKISKLYYQELLLDIEIDIQSLKSRIDYSNRVKTSIISLIDALENKNYAKADQDSLQYAINHYYRVPGWSLNLNTYKELESSGNLKYISNDEIRSAITDYVNGIESSNIVRERYTKDIVSKAFYIDKYVFTAFNKNGELYSIVDFEGLSNDKHIINYFSRIAMRWENNRLSFENLNELANKIQAKLKIELE